MNDRHTESLDRGIFGFEKVDSLCESFRQQWASAVDYTQRPSIKDHLAQVGEESQPTLLRNLLNVEIQLRRGLGEQPTADEYIEWFPRHTSLIRHSFLESTSLSRSVAAETGVKATIEFRAPAANRLGDYQLLRELGRGGMGMVFEALHMKHGNRVALKTLPALDATKLHLFKREFRSLADINHPNLVGLHTLEADGNQWFFTMDLLPGVDFIEYVRPGDQLDESRLRAALTQLVTGVMALHANHIVHRDLKPGNVMVSPDGHVALLDFGLIIELEQASIVLSDEKIAGTPAYMAPEQAMGHSSTAACDWYAVGVMLYEALVGERPFSGNVMKILNDKQHVDLSSLVGRAGVPDDLASLCMKLLARAPASRPDPLEITKVIASQASVATVPTTAAGDQLVGREQQLAALHAAHRTLENDGQPLIVLVSGRSGEGKSTLSEHFLAPLRRDKRLAVLSGRCYDRESVPFKALDNLIDGLCSFLRALPERDAALLMPREISLLVQVFPVLQRVEVVAAAPPARIGQLDEQQVRTRAFAALRELFSRLSDRSPIILFIDDLQWGDADSAEVLFELLRPPEPPLVLLLGTFRSDEVESSPFLQAWDNLKNKHDVEIDRRDVRVGPLTLQECTALAISILGKDNEMIRRRAIQFSAETGGNPYLLTELIGCFDPDSDTFQPMPMHEVIGQKLGRLPDDAERLLEVIAVSGQALSMDEASRTAGHELLPVSTITRMRTERLVRLIGPDENQLVDTYHDRIRETVVAEMEDFSRKATHRALAEVIEADVGGVSDEQIAALESSEAGSETDEPTTISRAYDLAYHFDAAGYERKAWVYGLLAAEQARRQYAPEVSNNQYTIAKRNAAQTTDAVRYRIASGNGEALSLLGRYDEAADELEGAIDLTDDSFEKARIEWLQGDNALKQGALKKSIAYYEQGLRRLGSRVPETRMGFALAATRELLVHGFHALFPNRLHKKPMSRGIALTNELLGGVSKPYFFTDMLKVAWSHLRGMNIAEQLPPSRELAFHYAHHCMLMSMVLGWHSRAQQYFERSAELNRVFNDVWGMGHTNSYQGLGLYAAARYEDAIEYFTKAIDAFSQTGDMWELNVARFHLGLCHYALGNLPEAIEHAQATFDLSIRIGDPRSHCSSYLWSRATNGNLPLDELKSCYTPMPEDITSTINALKAESLWNLAQGRTEKAVSGLERAWDLAKKNAVIMTHTVAALPLLVNALRVHADAVEAEDQRQSQQLRKRALRLAKRTVWITRFFPTERAYALRELSLAFAAAGKTTKALRAADKSCAIAERQNAKYEHAQSLLVRGRLAEQLSLPEAKEQVQAAEAALKTIESRIETPALASLGSEN